MADIVKHYVNNVSTQRSQDEEAGIFIQFAPINDLDGQSPEREDEPSLQNIGNATLPVVKLTSPLTKLQNHKHDSGSIPKGVNPKSVTTLKGSKGPTITQENLVSEANNKLTSLN